MHNAERTATECIPQQSAEAQTADLRDGRGQRPSAALVAGERWAGGVAAADGGPAGGTGRALPAEGAPGGAAAVAAAVAAALLGPAAAGRSCLHGKNTTSKSYWPHSEGCTAPVLAPAVRLYLQVTCNRVYTADVHL